MDIPVSSLILVEILWGCLHCTLYIAFIMLKYVLYSYSQAFIVKECEILSKFFCESNEMILWFLFFSVRMWLIMFIYLCILNHPYISETKPTWSWWIIFFMCSWILFANISLRILTKTILDYNFLLLLLFFVWL